MHPGRGHTPKKVPVQHRVLLRKCSSFQSPYVVMETMENLDSRQNASMINIHMTPLGGKSDIHIYTYRYTLHTPPQKNKDAKNLYI